MPNREDHPATKALGGLIDKTRRLFPARRQRRDDVLGRLAVGAIVKNEAPYLLEWVAAHRALGVDRFFIADNGSDDGTTELLAALHREGIVVHITFAGEPGQPPQLPAYAHILKKHGREADWIAFIDADEFLVPTDGQRSIRPTLEALCRDGSVGAVAVNWAVYGSSGRVEPGDGMVLERFSKRAEQTFTPNHHYKSIVRCVACDAPGNNPHSFTLKQGYRFVDATGAPLLHHPRLGVGLSAEVVWQPLRLNHYAVKSRAEFDWYKQPKGSATSSTRVKGDRYFAGHDRNEVDDPAPSWLLDATRSAMEELQPLLRSAGTPSTGVPVKGSCEAKRATQRPGGFIDRAVATASGLRLVGWSYLAGVEPRFDLTVGGQKVERFALRLLPRPDVERRVAGAGPRCGFELTVEHQDLPSTTALDGRDLELTVQLNDRVEVLRQGPGLAWPAEALRAKRAGTFKVPDKPAMPPLCAELLGSLLRGATTYLEYGCGGSTVLAASLGVPNVLSVESDAAWLDAVRQKVQALPSPHCGSSRFLPIPIDIGPTGDLGDPTSDERWRDYWRYPLEPWQRCRDEGLVPDVILIDGRFRVACLLAALAHARPGATIVFDDYGDRPQYRAAESLATPSRTEGRMAVFVAHDEQPEGAAMLAAFASALANPT